MKERWEVRPIPVESTPRDPAFPDASFGVFEILNLDEQERAGLVGGSQIPIALLDHSHNHSPEWRAGIRLRAEIMAAGPELLDALAALIPDAERSQAGYQSTPMLVAKALIARLRKLP